MAASDASPPSHPFGQWLFSRHPFGHRPEGVSPITVAGPHRIHTGFPCLARLPPLSDHSEKQQRASHRQAFTFDSFVNKQKVTRPRLPVKRDQPSRVPALICHCEERSDVAISMRLNTRRRTAVATPTRLPRYARNDKVETQTRRPRSS